MLTRVHNQSLQVQNAYDEKTKSVVNDLEYLEKAQIDVQKISQSNPGLFMKRSKSNEKQIDEQRTKL